MVFNVNEELRLDEVADLFEVASIIEEKDFGVFSVKHLKHICPETNKVTLMALINGMNGVSTLIPMSQPS